MAPMKSSGTVSVIGLGYIGLPTAAIFAKRGWNVVGVDVNQSAVDTINAGGVHIIEPDLDGVVARVVANGMLRATTTPEPADAFLIAVPTPFKDGHKPDLRYIEQAAKAIAPVLKQGDIIVLESTSPVGATEQMMEWMKAERPDLIFPSPDAPDARADVYVAHCPERVLPGKVLHELVHNDRIIGGITQRCSVKAATLYRTIIEGQCFVTDARTAEMCKLTENSFRDVNIAFANELSLICDRLGINVWELVPLANRHPRVNILQPGPGVGGHCIAVDPWFIVDSAPDEAQMIRLAREVNDGKPLWVVNKVKLAVADYLAAHPDKTAADVTVACLGLAFKPNIDDLRESPALDIAVMLNEELAGPVLCVEPHVDELSGKAATLTLSGADDAIEAADIIVLLVDHIAFHAIDEDARKGKITIDTRGFWN